MPVYQVPQFLDSGDKILGPLNVRQFAYALGGFFLSFVVFTIINSLAPLGVFSLLLVSPIAGLAAYLALGKYNGRDSEVYVLKYFLFIKKPRNLIFKRQPNIEDLKIRERSLSTEGIITEWNKRLATSQGSDKTFRQVSAEDKIRQIKELGQNIDKTSITSIKAASKSQDFQTTFKSILPENYIYQNKSTKQKVLTKRDTYQQSNSR